MLTHTAAEVEKPYLALSISQVFCHSIQHILQSPVLHSLRGVLNNLRVIKLDALQKSENTGNLYHTLMMLEQQCACVWQVTCEENLWGVHHDLGQSYNLTP